MAVRRGGSDEPVLEGGETVYTRCFVNGLKFRGNDVDLVMTLRVADPEGKTVLDEKDFASVRDSGVMRQPDCARSSFRWGA